ncbi:calcium/sodium antiporter [Xylanimonas allomyrinae]|uniref:Calcium/sodium antiporter n=1 Tax=Xylanimonas allomyrinae TaxID=2509459 RepID=A0A4P6EY13_9MICO|nr:calcium/sodium antiporter [Xylanimonas allomyrinae]QAY62948.1 calcium/sodium antiporter [Xylanimonas allomyrinae]
MTIVTLVAGLVFLIGGAEVIVRYGTRLARRLGISPLIVGLTVVSIGTSAPELAVGIDAMSRGQGSLVLGNIAGTNMVNLLLILGLAAAIRPIALQRQTLRLDLPAMVGSAVLLLALSLDGTLSTWEGVLLLGIAVGYTLVLIRTARRDSMAQVVATADPSPEAGDEPPRTRRSVVVDVLLLVLGIAVVVFGADWLVTAAVEIAELFGVSETLIGLTIVAIGTSLPELATTILATVRGSRSIAVGNLIGSSTYNLTFILGGSLLFGPPAVGVDPQLVGVDLPLMVGAALLCVPVFLTGRRISRREGIGFILLYAAYMTYLIVIRA